MSQAWQDLKSAFADAQGLDQEARQRYLQALAADKPELASELTALLEAQAHHGDFMQDPVWRWLSLPEHTPLEPLAPGTLIDGYRIVRPIGHGGMGTVYLAHQETPVQRDVALKVMHAKDSALSRFQLEQQILARLEHPHIARYYDAGQSGDGAPYLAMEFVNGPTITEWCAGLSLRERLELFLEVCDAVAFAHQCGVIHRDLKPANILVTHQGQKAQVKIIDFGISKDGTLTPSLTQTGGFLGTPDYVSPEQAGIVDAPVLHGADVYSLGVLLYRLLVGSLPFDLAEQPLIKLMATLRHATPAPPSTRTSEPSPPGLLWRDLDAVTLKALEKEPRFRYAYVTDLASDLRHALTGHAVAAAKPDPLYRLRKFWSRHRRALAVTAVALLLALSLAGWGFWERLQAARGAQFWNDYRVLESDLEAAYLLPLHDIRGQREQLRDYIAELERRLPHLYGRAATEAHHVLGRAYLTLHAYEQAAEHLELAARRAPASAEIAAHAGLSRALIAQEETARAKQIKDAAIRIQELARVQRMFVEPALADLERARKIDPAPRAYLEAVYAFLKGDAQTALAQSQRAIALEPFHYRAYLLLARVQQDLASGHYKDKNMPAFMAASQQAIAAFEDCLEVVRSYPAGYEALARELLELKKRTRNTEWADDDGLTGRAEYLVGQGLRADPSAPRLLGIMAQIQLEEVLDHYDLGDRERLPFDHLNEFVHLILAADPCEEGALRCAGQLGTYFARLTYPDKEAYDKLVEGGQAMELLLRQEPYVWGNYQALSTLYAFTMIAAAPHGLPARPWLEKSLALTREAGRYFPDTAAYHRTRAEVLQSYAMQMSDVGADPTEVIDLALYHFFELQARNLKQELEGGSVAELYRLRAQSLLLAGQDPDTDVDLTLHFAAPFSGVDARELELFNSGNALGARMSYRIQSGGDMDEPFWQALALYDFGMHRYPSYRLPYGAAQLCLDRSEAYRDKGDQKEAQRWRSQALAFAEQGERISPEYAGFPFIHAQVEARTGCIERCIDNLDLAFSQSPHCFGSFKQHWLYALLRDDPRMQELEKRYPDQSAEWREVTL